MQRVVLTSHRGEKRWRGRECWDTIFFFMLGHRGLVGELRNGKTEVAKLNKSTKADKMANCRGLAICKRRYETV